MWVDAAGEAGSYVAGHPTVSREATRCSRLAGGRADRAGWLRRADRRRGATADADAGARPHRRQHAAGGGDGDRPSGCPKLPAEAGRYICSSDGASGLALRPTTDAGADGPAGRAFTLTNQAEQVFETGRDRWLLAQRVDDGWLTVDAGGASADLALATGGSFTWVVSWAADEEPSGDEGNGSVGLRARVETQFGDGAHAFIVTGYTGDELASVMAPFWVPRSSLRTADGSRQ